MFARKAFVLFVCSIFLVCESAFVDNLGKCKVADSACQSDLFQSVLRDIAKTGIPEYDIPQIDPFPVKNVTVSVLNMVDITMVDGVAKGIKDCIVHKLETDVENEHATLEMTCDITIKGRYKVYGKSDLIKSLLGGSTVHGEGIGKVSLEKFHMKFDYHILVKEIDGEVLIQCQYQDLKYTYSLGKATFAANNLFLGKTEASPWWPALVCMPFKWRKEKIRTGIGMANRYNSIIFSGGLITSFLNDNWKFVMDTFGKPFLDKAMDIAYEQSHKFFDVVPTKYYLLDDLTPYIKKSK